eukprot:14651397-Ditylum_brightwellii.AAC.1
MLDVLLILVAHEPGHKGHNLVEAHVLIFLKQMFMLGEISIHQLGFAARARLKGGTDGAVTFDRDTQ